MQLKKGRLLHGRRSLVGCSPWGREESDTTERLHFHFSLWCIGEGNGNPLKCSCLEDPRDGGAWWAAVYGVAQSRTRLTRLSSSSSSSRGWCYGLTCVISATRLTVHQMKFLPLVLQNVSLFGNMCVCVCVCVCVCLPIHMCVLSHFSSDSLQPCGW